MGHDPVNLQLWQSKPKHKQYYLDNAIIGFAAISGLWVPLISKYGYRRLLILNCAIIIISWSLKQIQNYYVLIAARILGGTATGISSVIVPMFIKEISSTRIRGALIGLTQQMITVGVFVCMTISDQLPYFERTEVGDYWAKFDQGNLLWRLLFGFPIIVSFIQMLLLFTVFTKENPSYYEVDNSTRSANIVTEESNLSFITSDSRSAIQNTSENSETIANTINQREQDTYISFIKVFSRRRALISGVIALVFQQLSGVNMVFQYSDYFYLDNQDKEYKIKYVIGIVNMAVTFLSLYFWKVYKRKSIPKDYLYSPHSLIIS